MDLRRSRRVVPFIILGLAACGDNGGGLHSVSGVPASGTGTFTVAPIDVAALASITALGNLNPPGHTTPSDHTYWNFPNGNSTTSPQLPVYAPASGVVSWILGGSDDKIMVNVTNTFVYYLGHVLRAPGIATGTRVTAGQQIATSSGQGTAIDFGLINLERQVPNLAAPDRYPPETRNADSPLRYYVEPLRSILYAKVNREGTDKDGRVDYDVAGTLPGNWFVEDVPTDTRAAGPEYWSKQLAFVYDVIAPTSPRISIGGVIGPAAVYGVLSGPAFTLVTPASGVVAYRAAYQFAGGPLSEQVGTLLAQLLSPTRLRVEWVSGRTTPSDFTANARVYVR